MLVSKILSSVIQILLFALIPFLWWFLTARKKQSFNNWIGLKKFGGLRINITIASIATVVVFLLLGFFIQYILKDVETALSEFNGLGLRAVPSILVYGIFNTAFPEELLFRGFLLKRISSKIGFQWGNIIQAFLFGLIHCIMFWGLVNKIYTLIILVFTTSIAWTMGYINEHLAGGSLFPSWFIHAVSNVCAGIYAAFMSV